MARGGQSYSFEGNTVNFTASKYYGIAFKALESYYNWLPKDFWESLRSPMLRLDVPDGQSVNFARNKIA